MQCRVEHSLQIVTGDRRGLHRVQCRVEHSLQIVTGDRRGLQAEGQDQGTGLPTLEHCMQNLGCTESAFASLFYFSGQQFSQASLVLEGHVVRTN